jgi:hypothetical protein
MFRFFTNLLESKKTFNFYLAGKMRGSPELNKPMFTKVANLMREMGFTVWSPAEHKSYLQLSFAQCMTVDLNMVINKCNGIALLPGWENSLGANMEAFCAFACNKNVVKIVFNEDETEIELAHIDLSGYRLPYQDGEKHQFDPHTCPVDAEKPI